MLLDRHSYNFCFVELKELVVSQSYKDMYLIGLLDVCSLIRVNTLKMICAHGMGPHCIGVSFLI